VKENCLSSAIKTGASRRHYFERSGEISATWNDIINKYASVLTLTTSTAPTLARQRAGQIFLTIYQFHHFTT